MIIFTETHFFNYRCDVACVVIRESPTSCSFDGCLLVSFLWNHPVAKYCRKYFDSPVVSAVKSHVVLLLQLHFVQKLPVVSFCDFSSVTHFAVFLHNISICLIAVRGQQTVNQLQD